MGEIIPEQKDHLAAIRVAAREITIAGLLGSNENLHKAGMEVAQLIVGLDPDSVDRSSVDFAFGAAEGLSAALSVAREATPDVATVEFLLKKSNARLMVKIASEPRISESSLPLEGSEGDEIVNAVTGARIFSLSRLGIIEPAPPPEGSTEKAWQLSPWGKRTYIKLLPKLVESVGIDETLNGLRGILTTEEPK
jgi:hypothetical protein